MPHETFQALIARLGELREQHDKLLKEQQALVCQINELIAQNQESRVWAEQELERFRADRRK